MLLRGRTRGLHDRVRTRPSGDRTGRQPRNLNWDHLRDQAAEDVWDSQRIVAPFTCIGRVAQLSRPCMSFTRSIETRRQAVCATEGSTDATFKRRLGRCYVPSRTRGLCGPGRTTRCRSYTLGKGRKVCPDAADHRTYRSRKGAYPYQACCIPRSPILL